MDIQVSSNFERLIFEAAGRDGSRVCALMNALGEDGSFTLAEGELGAIRTQFAAEAVNESDVEDTIRSVARESGYACDPHTAVGIAAARRVARNDEPMVTLATAHPAKFPDAVSAATGSPPDVPLRLEQRLGSDERYSVIENDYGTLAEFIETHARAVQEPAT